MKEKHLGFSGYRENIPERAVQGLVLNLTNRGMWEVMAPELGRCGANEGAHCVMNQDSTGHFAS